MSRRQTVHLCGMLGEQAFLDACKAGCEGQVDPITMEPIDRRDAEQFVTRVSRGDGDDAFVSHCYSRRALNKWFAKSKTTDLPHNRMPLTKDQNSFMVWNEILREYVEADDLPWRGFDMILSAESFLSRVQTFLTGLLKTESHPLLDEVFQLYWKLRSEQVERILRDGGADRLYEYRKHHYLEDLRYAKTTGVWWFRRHHGVSPVAFVRKLYQVGPGRGRKRRGDISTGGKSARRRTKWPTMWSADHVVVDNHGQKHTVKPPSSKEKNRLMTRREVDALSTTFTYRGDPVRLNAWWDQYRGDYIWSYKRKTSAGPSSLDQVLEELDNVPDSLL